MGCACTNSPTIGDIGDPDFLKFPHRDLEPRQGGLAQTERTFRNR